MKYTHYKQVDAAADKLYAQGKREEILALLQSTVEQFPEYLLDNLTYQIYLYREADQQEQVQALYEQVCALFEKLIRQGYSCPLHLKIWKPLREKISPALIEENERLKALAQAQARMEYAVHLPEEYVESKRYPLFIALHGDDEDMQRLSWYWKPEMITKLGFILVYVQSSQVSASQRFVWVPKPQISRRDIKDCYEQVKAQYAIDPDKVIVGGFSGGAIIAVDITLADVFPIKGFVCLCPEYKTESFTIENLRRAVQRRVRGVFMEGEKVIPMPDEEEMMQAFREAGLPHQFYVNAGLGHAFPQDIAEKTRQAVDFILS